MKHPRPGPKPLPIGQAGGSSSSATTANGSRSQSSFSQTAHPLKRRRTHAGVLDGLLVHVIDGGPRLTKERHSALLSAIEDHGGRTVTIEHAQLIATARHTAAMLLPRLPDPLGGRIVVDVTWLEDSIAQGVRLDHAAYVPKVLRSGPGGANDDATSTTEPAPAAAATTRPLVVCRVASDERRTRTAKRPAYDPLEMMSCRRWTPLVCPNQALVDELRVLREYRRLSSKSQADVSGAISYGRAIASLKAYPDPLALPLPAKLAGFGSKIRAMAEEYLRDGRIAEVERAKREPRFVALRELTTIYGIGPTTAREFYDGLGTGGHRIRSIADLRAHCGERFQHALRYAADLAEKIPRAEVEEIGALVDGHLQVVAPGAIYQIVGGYRRGKAESNDIDVVFTRPDGASVQHVLDRLVDRLVDAGLIVHLISTFGGDSKRPAGAQHFHSSSMDPLDKSFGIWRSPVNGTTRLRPTYRRVDIIAVEATWVRSLGGP